MKLIIEINEEEMLRNLFEDLSDQCDGGRYECVGADQENFIFTFSREDGSEHLVDLEKAIEGFRKFVLGVHSYELVDFTDLDTDMVQDPEQWNCDDIDLLLQYIIDGEVVEP